MWKKIWVVFVYGYGESDKGHIEFEKAICSHEKSEKNVVNPGLTCQR